MGVVEIVAVVIVVGVAVAIARTIAVREKRRREARPLVRWQPDPRPEDERLESYRDQLLRELGPRFGSRPADRTRRIDIESRLP